MNIKNGSCGNVKKQRDINGGEEYTTLDISLKFDSLDKMRITSSEPQEKLGRSGKGMITSLGIKAKEIRK